MNSVQKYQLNGTIHPLGCPELVNPKFYRGNVTYESLAPVAHIGVKFEVETTEGQVLTFDAYYTLPCETDWISDDAEKAMLSIPELKDCKSI
jgi:hypothetical protein